ncbi:TonB-linked SusC/RagA family outer membrane protein [Flavobacterium sp. 2755]|uniref:TonB-dependent receptor n=1 Tax=Flavobacterium sp. 2755 TaxID=2817765 RepID=UPI00285ED08C|nr:TonB-dependent receptor [Flavobacterium sp. 2755]MDR6763680.1 TonB-linked SusC/RagA family outer membrane protein [Flavobacterium sp. 2755]
MKKLLNSIRIDTPFLKFDLKMKLTTLFLLTTMTFMQAGVSYSQKAKMSFSASNMTVAKVIEKIEYTTDYRFVYNVRSVDLDRKIDIRMNDVSMDQILNSIFKNTGTDFKVSGNHIILLPKEEQNMTKNLPLKEAPPITITGKVTDANGVPLPGVNIISEMNAARTTTLVVTDFDGQYTISVPNQQTVLMFYYMGFETQKITVGDKTVINVTMKASVNKLDELVLIGYGQQKSANVTGAVSSVKMNDFVQQANGVAGFDRALGGLIKGVQVAQNSGRPGSPVMLNIRGITSPLSGSLNQPLYVIDGVPFNIDGLPGTYDGGSNPLLALNPNDIESINVLKDAAATSIYGSRGANGVIIVTSKKGKKGRPVTNVSYSSFFATPINTVRSLNTAEYKDFYNRILSSSTMSPFDAGMLNFANMDLSKNPPTYLGLNEDAFGKEDINWNDKVFRDMALTQQANVNFSGGSDATNYIFGVSTINQEGLVVKDKYNQYNMRFHLDTKLSDYVKVGGTMNGGYNKSQSGETSTRTNAGVNTAAVQARPDQPYMDAQGNLLPWSDYTYGFETFTPNPLQTLNNKNIRNSYNFIGNSYVEVTPIKNLSVKADVNSALFINQNSIFSPKSTMVDFGFANKSTLTDLENVSSNITTNLTANYDFKIKENNFGFLVGYSWDRTKYRDKRNTYSGFPDDEVLTNASSAERVTSYSDQTVESGINSLFSRLTYNYKDKYNVTVNFRTDASSKFGPENKRGYFPSISGSWNLAKEAFLADNSIINKLQLRASIGKVGSTNVANFSYLQFFSTSSSNLYAGNTAVVASTTLPNQNIGWETTKEYNLGLDFSLVKDRIKGSFDYYNRQTTGALAKTPVPLELGPSQYYSNLMDVSNKGIEVSLGADIIKTKDFLWNFNINWSFNRNILEKLNSATISSDVADNFTVGKPVGTLTGYKVVKIIQTQDELNKLNAGAPDGLYGRASLSVGDYQFADINGDGEVTSLDRTVIGSMQPDFFGGFSNVVTYKSISLSALFQYSVGAEAYWDMLLFQGGNYLGQNVVAEYGLNTWSPTNTDARFAKPTYQDPSGNSRSSDRQMYDTSYLRLKSIQLTYQLPKQIIDNLHLSNGSVYISGTNLWTWTKWPGSDPESYGESGLPSITGQTRNSDPYPLAKAISLGFNLQF